MTIIQHKDIPDFDLHEPKGVGSAPDGAQLFAFGGGSLWSLQPFAMLLDSSITETDNVAYAPLVKSGGSVYSFGQALISESVNFGLQYTGSNPRTFLVTWHGSIKQDQIGVKQMFVAPHLNGTLLPLFEATVHANQDEYVNIGGQFIVLLQTNDVIDLYAYDADVTHVITIDNPVMIFQGLGPESM